MPFATAGGRRRDSWMPRALYALPGLVDIHFHGAMGKDFCDGNEEAIQTLADFEAGKGVLAICPATMTFSEEILNGVMDAAAAHQKRQRRRPCGHQHGGALHQPQQGGCPEPGVSPQGGCCRCSAACRSGQTASSSWWTSPRRSRVRWSSSKSAMGRSASRMAHTCTELRHRHCRF